MKNDSVFITTKEFFESTSLRNPICSMDHKLELIFPNFYSVSYDTKLLATKAATDAEKQFPFYNDYREQFGTTSILALDTAIINADAKQVFLNGFDQKQFLYIAPKIKDTAEILYLYKCPRINNLSVLAQFHKLKCLHIYWNNSMESLWDMRHNKQLQVLSFTSVSKLSKIAALVDSCVEYVSLDSEDNNGHTRKVLFDTSVFNQMPHLKHLSLRYSDCVIDY